MGRTDQGKGGTGVPSFGFPWRRVLVQSITDNVAQVAEISTGSLQDVRVDIRRGGGLRAQVGEEWIVDRSQGFWTFGTLVSAKPVVVTGSRDANPAVAALLTMLAAAGLIEDQTTLGGGDTAWHAIGAPGEPAFLNTWKNYGGEWAAAAFRKDSEGFVHLRGLIDCTAGNNTFAFTLPVGYRPGTNQHNHHPVATNGQFGLVRSRSTGTLECFNPNIAQGGAVPWLDLSSVTFRAEN